MKKGNSKKNYKINKNKKNKKKIKQKMRILKNNQPNKILILKVNKNNNSLRSRSKYKNLINQSQSLI